MADVRWGDRRDCCISAQLPLDQTDLAILRAIREALPNANDSSPDQIFEQVLQAVRAHAAKTIDCPKNARSSDSKSRAMSEIAGDFGRVTVRANHLFSDSWWRIPRIWRLFFGSQKGRRKGPWRRPSWV
jgi:hypothetical protein